MKILISPDIVSSLCDVIDMPLRNELMYTKLFLNVWEQHYA